jgi:hypothetical protein
MQAGSSFDELGLELLKHGYRRFETRHLYCSNHGLVRLNLEVGAERWPCPICGEERDCSLPLQRGYTRYQLPTFDVVVRRIAWEAVAEDEFHARPIPKPGVDGRSRHYRKTFQVGLREAALT